MNGRCAASALALLLALPAAAQTDRLRIEELRQDIRRLERTIQEQARRIDRLERQLAQAGRPTAPATGRGADGVPAGAFETWIAPERWDRVREGMTAQEVISILGPPTAVRPDGTSPTRTLFYTLQIGDTAFLSGTVRLENDRVRAVERPTLR